MTWYIDLLIGMGIGLIFIPIWVGLAKLYKNLKTKMLIKRLLKKRQFLIPIDPRDYNAEAWKDYINPEDYKEDLQNFNNKICNKKI